MKHIILSLVVCLSVLGMSAENRIRYTHYSTDDGLSQNRVMDIEQDHRGFMWFATWDGLNRFDGKSFRVYKGIPGDPEGFDINRLLSVKEDHFGQLWILTRDLGVYRFNPKSERFHRLSWNPDTRKGLIRHAVYRIVPLLNKDVVLLVYGGCYIVHFHSDASVGKVSFLSKENGRIADNRIREVFSDDKGNTWFLTQSGLTCFNEKVGTYQHYFHQDKNRTSFSCSLNLNGQLYFGSFSGKIWHWNGYSKSFQEVCNLSTVPITSICSVIDNHLLVSTLGDGMYLTDGVLNVHKHFRTTDHPEMGSDVIHSLYRDKRGDVWLEVETSGVVYFDVRNLTFHHTDYTGGLGQKGSASSSKFFVLEDNKGHLWIHGRNGGFFSYDAQSRQVAPFSQKDNLPNRRFFGLFVDALVDKDGNLWISTGEPRLEKCTFEPARFVFESTQSIYERVDGSEVRTLFEDNSKRIWICDKEGKIRLKDSNGRFLGYLRSDGTLSSSMVQTDLMVYDMIQDKKGRIWMACKGRGVVLLEERNGSVTAFDVRFVSDEAVQHTTSLSKKCYSLLEDSLGRIWVGTYGGGLNLVDESNGAIHYLTATTGLPNYPLKHNPEIRDMAVDKKGIVWLATVNGLVAFDSHEKNPTSIRFFRYYRNGNDAGSLRTNDVHCVYIDDQNNRWFGTFGGGLNRLKSGFKVGDRARFDAFTQKNGLPSDIVMSIEEDYQGFFWLFSENSITRFDVNSSEIDVYNKDYGLETVMFSESSSFRLQNGDICAGTLNGYYRFNPSMVKKASFTPPLYFTGFYLFNKEVTVNTPGSPLSDEINEVKRIVLKNEQDIVSFEFAALDFRNPGNIQYAYRLDPIDREWNILNKSNRVSFTSLSAGEYTLRVRSTNSEGVWMENERSLTLVIRPSAWQTGWAIALYVAIGLVMLFYMHRRLLDRLKLRSKVTVERKVVEAKKQFLSNVTRELRIPLMLIEAPIEQVSRDKGLSPDSTNNLAIVKRNIDRMMRLVNRILDYQKNMDRKMTLMVEETPIKSLVEKIAKPFEVMAQDRGITFVLNDQSNGVLVYVDKEKFDTILHILLTNAIKFTRGGKTVSLKVYVEDKQVVVEVDDEGMGISKENMEHLFDQLSVLDETEEDNGIGIGLGLAKELVELHGGNINATSQEGVGTTFKIGFLLGKDHFTEGNVVLIQPEFYPGEISEERGLNCKDSEAQPGSNQQPLLVVVEDQKYSHQTVTAILSNHYRVATVGNIPGAWDAICHLMPDFVVIDNNVSGDGGLGLAIIMKESEQTCHIPVILLAEKSTDSLVPDRISDGVDEVISKPFNTSYLEARIENFIVQRSLMRERVRRDLLESTSRSFVSSAQLEPWDNEFLSRIMDFLTDNLSNSELNVDMLVSFIGLGRSAFINKLKNLLGLTPLELIREIRLKRAAELLESGRYNVSEVVIQLGMKDTHALSKCFKQRFGMTPTEYRNKSATNKSKIRS